MTARLLVDGALGIGARRSAIGVRSSGPALQAETTAWLAAVAANLGAVGTTAQNAIDALIIAGKSGGWFSKLKFLWIPVGDYAASAVCLIHPNPDRLVTRVNFVAGDYSELTGYDPGTGNSTKYIDTNFIPASHLSLWSASMGVHSHTGGAFNPSFEMGANQASGSEHFNLALLHGTGPTSLFDAFMNSGSGRSIWTETNNAIGVYIGSRTSQTDARVYRNGAEINSNSGTSSGILPTFPLFLFALNRQGAGAINHGKRRMTMAFTGDGLTAADIASFQTALQNFYVAMNLASVSTYVQSQLPNIPAGQVSGIAAAAIRASVGQPFTANQVVDALNADRGIYIMRQGFGREASDGSGAIAANGSPVGWVGSLNNSGPAVIQATTAIKPTQSTLGADFDGVDDVLRHATAFACQTIIAVASAPHWATFPQYAGLVTGTTSTQGENFAVGDIDPSFNTFWFNHVERATLIDGVATAQYLPAPNLKVVSGSYATRNMGGLTVGQQGTFSGRVWRGTIAFVLLSTANYLSDSRELMVRRFCNAYFI